MKIINLDIFLWRLRRRASKIAINNAFRFNISSRALPFTVCNNYSTSCTNIDSTLGNRKSVLSNVMVKYNSRIWDGFPHVSHPRIVSHIILYDGKKLSGYKPYHSTQYCNSIRYFSNVSVDSIAEAQVPTQFNYIFKTISDSEPVKIMQDFLLLMHDYTGLPWWSIIVLTTIIMRTIVTLPLSFYQVHSLIYLL